MDRMQRNLALVVALVLTAAVLALGPSASAGAAPPPECINAQLSASYKPGGAATSHRFGNLVLRNTSRTTCWVQGYGGLSYVAGASGRQVGAAATRTPSPVERVVLEPRQAARSSVSETTTGPYSPAQCRPTRVRGFRVYAPDQRTSQFVPHPTTTCANKSLKLLAHKAYRSSQ
jgi:hypothetical protein